MKQLERMIIFAAVVDTGSFTAAARQLGCSKAHVSQQISRLERDLGVQLLFRTTRRLELTEAGVTYLRYCRRLRETTAAANQAVDALRGEMTGEIRMTVPVSFGEMVLRELVRPFLDRYPGIDFRLELENQLADLRAGRYDIALRTPAPADDQLVALRLTDYTELLCASPGYLTGIAPIEHPDDLASHRFLLNSHFRERSWQLARDGAHRQVAIGRRLTMNHYSLLRRAALEGLGIAKLPAYLIADDLKSGRLRAVLPDHAAAEPRPVFLVYPWQRTLPLKNRRFIDFVLERFGLHPPERSNGPSPRLSPEERERRSMP